MAGAAGVDWEETCLDTDSDMEFEEDPGLASNDDDVEDFSLVSEESLIPLPGPNYALHPDRPASMVGKVGVRL